MKTWLGIHLEDLQPGEDTLVSWALSDADGQLLGHGSAPLGRVRAQAGREAEKAQVNVFVPGNAVMLTEVSIPSRQAAHLRKALPFMIEEQIAGDMRQTHLAVAPQRFGDSVPVAVVAHAQMIAWLEALHAAGLSPAAMIPEHLLLPREPGSIFVHVHGNRAMVRLGDCRGVVTEAENLVLLLDLALNERAIPCSRIEISACAERGEDLASADRLGVEIGERLERPVRRTNFRESLVELLAVAALGPNPQLNLCQGGYRMSAGRGEGEGRWTVAWLAGAASVAVFMLGCFGAGMLLDHQAQSVHDESVAQFRRMFPDERRIINLRRQAEARLSGGASGGNPAMLTMAGLASALADAEVSGLRVQTLRYAADGGALTADLEGGSLGQVDRLEQSLNQSGLSARVLSAREEGGVANARIELRRQ